MRRIAVTLAAAQWRVAALSLSAGAFVCRARTPAVTTATLQRRWQATSACAEDVDAATAPAAAAADVAFVAASVVHDDANVSGAGKSNDASDVNDHDNDVAITDADGNEVTVQSVSLFSELRDVPAWLQRGIASLGFPAMMGIQRHTFPVLEQGHDVVGLAPTGSGKTVAFAVPALMSLARQQQQEQHSASQGNAQRSSGAPMVLVLAPTRELVQQTSSVFRQLAGDHARIAEAYGGAPRDVQARKLRSGCDVLVACPGRLKDFLGTGDVCLDALSFVVFDEADRLLDMGFKVQLDEIMSYAPAHARVQKMMWSATWPPAVQSLAYSYLSPQWRLIRVGAAGTGAQLNAHIAQTILFAPQLQERIDKLAELIEQGRISDTRDKLILFVERQTDTDDAAWALSRRLDIDVNCIGVLHGGMPQQRRDSVMRLFKSNKTRLLIATDVASRGLDIPDITCVVNLQAPKSIDSYCHRIGRTGRAGRSGVAFTFVGPDDGYIAAELIDYLQRCKMDVPHELHELAASYTAAAQTRRWRGNGSRGGGGGRRDGGRREGGRREGGRREGGRREGGRRERRDFPHSDIDEAMLPW